MSDSDRAALLALGRTRCWGRGDMLVRHGEAVDAAIVIRKGLVKIHRINAQGGEILLGLVGPGDVLGEVAVVRDAQRSANATALESVEGVSLPISQLRRFVASHPNVVLALLDLTVHRLHVADVRRIEFATGGSLGRVTSRLVELAERFGSAQPDGAIDVRLPLTQDELASWSAASRESTARALRTLRELGLIETRRLGLIVRDLDGLRAHQSRL